MVQETAIESPFFYLETRGPGLTGRQFDVDADGLLVGRSPSCDVIVEDREVSRRHCYFYPDGAFCYVKDLGSKNGTLVNSRAEKQRRLEDGDVVDVGPSRFTFHVHGGPPGEAMPDPYAGLEEASRPHAPLGPVRHPLAPASLVFAFLALLHWAFGLGAVVLALLSLWEMRGERDAGSAGLARGALVLGLVGAALNGWFAAAAPAFRAAREDAARLACRDNLLRIASALAAYASEHGDESSVELGDLVAAGKLEPADIHCPACALRGRTSCPYIYLGGKSTLSGHALGVVACDASLANHGGSGGWVLRSDGRVEWLPADRFRQLLEELDELGRLVGGGGP
jgi:hypothetical protein